MDKQRKEKLMDVLEFGVEGKTKPGANVDDVLELRSLNLLAESGYIHRNPLFTTLSGLSYLERLKAPRKAWLKKNWFAVSIAATTAFIGLASVIVQILAVILE